MLNVLAKREVQWQALVRRTTHLVCFQPGHLRWRFTGEFDLHVELLSSLELMLLQKIVSINSWFNCNRFSTRLNTRNAWPFTVMDTYSVYKKETKMFLVIFSTQLGRLWWSLVHRLRNKFAAKLYNVSTLPCKTWNAHQASASIELLQKDTTEFIPQLWPPNWPDLNPVAYRMCGLLQQKVYKILITDVDELKQRLRTEWPSWIMSSLWQPFVSGVFDSSRSVMRVLYTFS